MDIKNCGIHGAILHEGIYWIHDFLSVEHCDEIKRIHKHLMKFKEYQRYRQHFQGIEYFLEMFMNCVVRPRS
jgi:hypothetical protein